mmetsp:Transcript_111466/g.249131  ORF Transcript_111466/g.249131 Transcript_111466/m.249131 type:complete len:234 (-) Transcript_111466:173-874(-)
MQRLDVHELLVGPLDNGSGSRDHAIPAIHPTTGGVRRKIGLEKPTREHHVGVHVRSIRMGQSVGTENQQLATLDGHHLLFGFLIERLQRHGAALGAKEEEAHEFVPLEKAEPLAGSCLRQFGSFLRVLARLVQEPYTSLPTLNAEVVCEEAIHLRRDEGEEAVHLLECRSSSFLKARLVGTFQLQNLAGALSAQEAIDEQLSRRMEAGQCLGFLHRLRHDLGREAGADLAKTL